MICQKNLRMIYNLMRYITTSSRVHANHYDVLGITPRATQGDIKSAYYKLSKLYHPDKSSDEESAKKFRAITEAYEILGNLNLKKMYDKGLLVGHDNRSRMSYQPDPEPTDPTLKFYHSRMRRQVVPTMNGTNAPIYDFDSWSKNHYGEVFKKSQYEKDILEKIQRKQQDNKVATNHEAILYVMLAMGGLFIYFAAKGTADYDQVGAQKNIENNDKR